MIKKLFVVLCVSFTHHCMAAVVPPTMLNYQGYLAEENGNPATGSVHIVIALFTNATGGSSVFMEDVGDVSLDKGVYSFTYGNNTPGLMESLNHPEVWTELTIDAATMAPRQRLAAVPYALYAGSISQADSAVDNSNGLGSPVFAQLATRVTSSTSTVYLQTYTVPTNKTLVINGVVNLYDWHQANRPATAHVVGPAPSYPLHTWIRVIVGGTSHDINVTTGGDYDSYRPNYGLDIRIPGGSEICCGHSLFFHGRLGEYVGGDYKALLIGTLY